MTMMVATVVAITVMVTVVVVPVVITVMVTVVVKWKRKRKCKRELLGRRALAMRSGRCRNRPRRCKRRHQQQL